MTTTGEEWYWCLRHQRPEQGEAACEADHRLGPYASEEEARHWKERVDARNEQWEEDDRRWNDPD